MSAAPLKPDLPQRDLQAARRELLAIQKRLWRRLNREIEASIEENPPNVEIYQEEFARDLRRYEAVSSKAELVEAAVQADIVYVGDYHTLPQSQKTLVKLLLALTRLRPEVVLCMEVVHADKQDELDRYMSEQISEEEFLRRIDYESTWGFPWPPYREVFAVARARGLRVVAINSDPLEHTKDHLIERDFRAARVIAREIRQNPEALLVVFDGDLHVARDHLPLIVDTVLDREGLGERRGLIVHQNAEEIYWRLAREAQEQEVNVVRLAPDAYCVLNASPFEKLHSYLNWVSERESLEPPVGGSTWELEVDEDEDEEDDEGLDDIVMSDLGAEYAEQVHQIVETIARFLGIARDDLDAFELFTVNDLDFLAYLDSGGLFTAAEREDIKRQILSNESYFIPKANIIYLSDFSVVNAAEEGTHFLHHLCAGYRWDHPRDLTTDFYFRCVTEALGFFGSKLVVPTRECWTARDCEAFVEHHRQRERARRRRRRIPTSGESLEAAAIPDAYPKGEGPVSSSTERVTIMHSRKVTLKASRLVLRHKRIERTWLETGQWGALGAVLTQPAEVHLLLTHMLGHMLGDKLYHALVRGQVDKAEVHRLFHEPLDKRGVALRAYQRLLELVRGITHDPVRADRL